jgi:hypothetical protein
VPYEEITIFSSHNQTMFPRRMRLSLRC